MTEFDEEDYMERMAKIMEQKLQKQREQIEKDMEAKYLSTIKALEARVADQAAAAATAASTATSASSAANPNPSPTSVITTAVATTADGMEDGEILEADGRPGPSTNNSTAPTHPTAAAATAPTSSTAPNGDVPPAAASNLPVPQDDLDEQALQARARAEVGRLAQTPSFTSPLSFNANAGNMEEGVSKNMYLKECWIREQKQPSQAITSGTHTLSFRNVEFLINGKTEIIESPKVAIDKKLDFEDVWQTLVSRLDRDVLMTKYHNLAKKENHFLR